MMDQVVSVAAGGAPRASEPAVSGADPSKDAPASDPSEAPPAATPIAASDNFLDTVHAPDAEPAPGADSATCLGPDDQAEVPVRPSDVGAAEPSRMEFEFDSDPCLDDDDSLSSSSSDDESDVGVIDRADLDAFVADALVSEKPLRTVNEIDPDTVEIPDRRAIPISSESTLREIGLISSFVEGTVVIMAKEGAQPIDIGGALALHDRTPLGYVDDVFGPVQSPFYLVRVRADDDLSVSNGAAVFAVEELSALLEAAKLDRKGTDASYLNDEEDKNQVEYSDDEEEQRARQERKASAQKAKRATGPPRPARPSPSMTFPSATQRDVHPGLYNQTYPGAMPHPSMFQYPPPGYPMPAPGYYGGGVPVPPRHLPYHAGQFMQYPGERAPFHPQLYQQGQYYQGGPSPGRYNSQRQRQDRER
ncbi:H/ACA ribonucleoprotein complex non-core subunit NAF1 [Plasmodiophora brassicae]|uniref:H/ACA ribonucleoprotein complex non-core subunit NAF1 n=2 Tax=Plasmodiophora brassicae TaxID=37360 RepID=A0A3P3YH86_PLABS|nr:unnamed protein product [Plasmodiophora brassicae]